MRSLYQQVLNWRCWLVARWGYKHMEWGDHSAYVCTQVTCAHQLACISEQQLSDFRSPAHALHPDARIRVVLTALLVCIFCTCLLTCGRICTWTKQV
eukprot:1149062-Pelagomonas_calceolata.AAC.11